MQNEISGKKRYCTFRLLMGLLLLCSLLCAPGAGVLAESGTETLIPLHVEAGTNLITLAKTYCKRPEDWKTIARINRLSPPYVIYADGEIEVPRELLQLEPLSLQAVAVKGEVILQQANGEQTALKTGSRIASGDTVVTGEDSFAHLVFPNGVHTRVEPQSTLTVSYLFRLRDGHIKVELALTRGEVVNTINRKLRSNDSMRTKTPVVVTGIRGTSYRLKVEDPRSTQVETLQGEVSVQSGQRALRLRADEGVKARLGQRLRAAHPLPSPPSLKGVPTLYRTLPAHLAIPKKSGITSVNLRLSTDAEGLASVYECSAPAGQPLVVQEVPDGRYYAFFTVTDTKGFESREQAIGEIEIRTMPPAPVVTAPRNSSVQWGENAQMSWLESAQAVGYRVQISRDASFTELLDEQKLTSPAYTSPPLPPGDYYGRVQAEAEDGFLSDYSGVIGWQQREAPSLSGMEGKSGEAPFLQWASMGENWRYDLQVAADKDFKEVLLDLHGLDAPSYAFAKPLIPGRYSIRLRGLPPDGQPTPWTPPQTLHIKNPPKNLEGGLIGALILGIILL